ncbi:cation:proton antiporter [Plectonema cf. radiosum LEGE 06105]|uniref:Cation:proton antiporter n=1 Tax=Plectonema cf. radiosum LEGE 06105 TaxID=945769 RepID=A0A8J7JYI7_9CYAN|nr:cation:proton antiporter [Plectonema radiosum]MBE9211702.1 cation:proton antiporter [Plectonema cf. radiosum LEGE 06105]
MAASGHSLIVDFTTVLGASALGGYIANKLRQPVLLGYLASGLIVGPFGFKLLNDVNLIKSLAEFGVAFLLFALGVEFSFAEVKRVKDIAISGSLLQIALTTIFVTLITVAFGWASGLPQGIFLGVVFSLSSTAVVLKTLTEKGETYTVHGQIMLAILIVQDLALGIMLAILPALKQPENIAPALFLAVVKVIAFGAIAFILSRWVVPGLIRNIAATESDELFLITIIALCLGVALITAALGLSIEMGAFVAGLMISEIDYADHALAKVLPLRDTFASLFFASIGMLIDPTILINNFWLILGLVTLIMVGKAAIVFPIVLKFGYSVRTAVITALGINQIGEFSFVLELTGLELKLISEEVYLLLLGTTAITLVVTPILLERAPKLADKLTQIPFIFKYLRRFEAPKSFSIPDTINSHVVVAGYGRVGQVVVKILQNQGYPLIVIDNCEPAIQRLRSKKIPYLFGDADSELVLEKAHLEKAKALVIALPDAASTRILLEHALSIAPGLDIIARSHSDKEIDILTQMGAKEVVQPEFEAALELGTHLLKTLGAKEYQIYDIINKIRIDKYLSIRPDR